MPLVVIVNYCYITAINCFILGSKLHVELENMKQNSTIIASQVPINKKKIFGQPMMKPMMKLWWNCGEDCFKMFSVHERLLGPRIRTWRRRDRGLLMIYGDSLSSLSMASSYSGGIPLFSLAHGRLRSCPGQPAHATRPNIIQYVACAVCQCVQDWRTQATFHEGWGM